MKVRAIEPGQYGGQYRPAGEVFELVPRPGCTFEQQVGRWMEVVDDNTPVGRPTFSAFGLPVESAVGVARDLNDRQPTGDQEVI